MNQILITKDDNYFLQNIISSNKKYKKNYLLIFIVSIIICIVILSYLIYSYFLKINEISQTNILKDKYNVTTLYPANANYNAVKLSNNISIIGLLEIPSISISYPILSDSSDELLKISVCRFSGPLPNRNRKFMYCRA